MKLISTLFLLVVLSGCASSQPKEESDQHRVMLCHEDIVVVPACEEDWTLISVTPYTPGLSKVICCVF
jgi:hypothetical protein